MSSRPAALSRIAIRDPLALSSGAGSRLMLAALVLGALWAAVLWALAA